jgi:hypothetical protein
MRIKVTKPGIFGLNGEIPVGTEVTVKEEPKGWDGRYEVISGSTEGKTAVTNPADDTTPAYEVKATSPGWFAVFDGDEQVTKGLRKDDVDGFDAKSDADKAAFVEANKAED